MCLDLSFSSASPHSDYTAWQPYGCVSTFRPTRRFRSFRSDTARAHSIWNSSIRPDHTNKAKSLDDYTGVLTRPTLVIAMGTHTLSSALPNLLLTPSITQRSKSRIWAWSRQNSWASCERLYEATSSHIAAQQSTKKGDLQQIARHRIS